MRYLALLPLLSALVAQGTSPIAGEDVCRGASPAIVAWVEDHLTDDQGARDRMTSRIDRVLAQSDGSSECALRLRLQRVELTSTSGEYTGTIATTGEMLSDPLIADFPDLEAYAHNARAIALVALGRTAESKQEFFAAAALVPQLPASRAALILVNLAEEDRAERNWLMAERSYRQAMRILRDSSASNPSVMRAYMGRVYAGYAFYLTSRAKVEEDPARRTALARRTLVAADTAVAMLNSGTASTELDRIRRQGKTALTWVDRAYAEALLGRHSAAARRIQAASALATPDVQTAFPYLLTDLWLSRAETEQLAGRLGAAAEAAERSGAFCQKNEDVACEADAIELLAHVLEEDGHLGDAERQYRSAIRLRDIEWERGRLQDWNARAFAAAQTPYRALTHILVHQGRTQEAFAVLDGARARALRDMRNRLSVREGLTPERQTQIESMLEDLAAERLAYLADDATPEDRLLRTRRISQINTQLESATRATAEPLRPLDLRRLQKALRLQKRTLVSYLVEEDETIVFAVTSDTLVARVVPTPRRDLISTIRQAGGPWESAESDMAVRLRPLHTLYTQLVQPVREWIPEGNSLVVVPDGVLGSVPFGALLEAPAEEYTSARFLIRSHPVSTDLAAAMVVSDEEQRDPLFSLDVLAFGRSQFQDASEASKERGGRGLANLPNVATEIGRIRMRIGNHETALDERATESRFESEAARARIVHIASHAEADAAFPLYSKIHLWDAPDASDDGVVHLFELQSLRLPSQLVVLSGCSTGAGRAEGGEGMIGLQYGVRAAGASATLATLWAVDDQATSEIIDTFYEGLEKGLPKDVALQRAQIAYIDQHPGAEASPYYWAAPVLSGSTVPLPLHAPVPVWLWGLGGVALAAGAGRLAWRTRTRRLADA